MTSILSWLGCYDCIDEFDDEVTIIKTCNDTLSTNKIMLASITEQIIGSSRSSNESYDDDYSTPLSESIFNSSSSDRSTAESRDDNFIGYNHPRDLSGKYNKYPRTNNGSIESYHNNNCLKSSSRMWHNSRIRAQQEAYDYQVQHQRKKKNKSTTINDSSTQLPRPYGKLMKQKASDNNYQIATRQSQHYSNDNRSLPKYQHNNHRHRSASPPLVHDISSSSSTYLKKYAYHEQLVNRKKIHFLEENSRKTVFRIDENNSNKLVLLSQMHRVVGSTTTIATSSQNSSYE